MEKGLDEILGEEPQEPEAAVEQQPEPEATAEPEKVERPRGPDGKFAPKTGVEPEQPAPEAVPPTAGLPKDVYEPLRAVRDENRQLKDQIEALNREFQKLHQPKEPSAPPPSMWEDEQGWQQHFGQTVTNAAVEQATFNSKLTTSEIIARQSHEDFGEVWGELNSFLTENPAVTQKALADSHPWGFAYKAYKNHQQMQELGATNLDELRAKIREEVLAEAMAQVPVAKPNAPPTLTNERNVGSRSGPAWSGPKSIDELLS